jgi:hypothetical protein
MVAGADTVGTQKGTPWNAWWNGENWALRQVWPIIQTPGYIYTHIYIELFRLILISAETLFFFPCQLIVFLNRLVYIICC